MRKYEMTDETKVVMGHTLHRIRALKSFRAGTEDDTIDVDNGDSGGWIEQECNLSQSGTAWVDDTSCAFGNAAVADDALVAGYSMVYDRARITGRARVTTSAKVFGNATITDDAYVWGDVRIYDWAYVCHDATVYEDSRVFGHALIGGFASISGNVQAFGDAHIEGNAEICGDSLIFGTARVDGHANIFHSAMISAPEHVLTIDSLTSSHDCLTFFRSKDDTNDLCVASSALGRYFYSVEDFDEKIPRILQSQKKSADAKLYLLASALAKAQILKAD